MARAKFFINGAQKQLVKSIVTKQGCRAIDQACFTIPHTINVEVDNDLHYIQDIVDLTNLKGMWTFDCHTGDESGYEHHGAGLVNIPSALIRYEFDRCCNISTATLPLTAVICGCGTNVYTSCSKVGCKAFCFNGCSSLIIPCECKFDFRQDQKWSIALWIYPTVACANQGLVVKRDAFTCDGGYSLEINACNNIQFDIATNVTENNITSMCTIPLCMWTHVAATFNALSNRSGMKLYINGLLDTTGTCMVIGTPVINCCSVTLGASSVAGCKYTGRMDDVYIFKDKTLTVGQVKAIYDRGSISYVEGKWGNAAQFDGVAGHVTVEDKAPPDPRFGSLVAQYKFECVVTDDRTDGCHCGTVTGCTTFVASIIDCKAFSFNGCTRINLCCSADFSFAKTLPFAFGGWINVGMCAAGNDIIFSKRLDLTAGSRGYSLHFDNTCCRPVFQISDGTCIYSVSGAACSLPSCEWHHVLAVYDGGGDNAGMSLIIDGVETVSTTACAITSTITNCLTASIGGGNAGACDFCGLMDCIRFWNTCLTEFAGKALYNGTFSQLTGEYEIVGWIKATQNCCDRKVFTKSTASCNGIELILECATTAGPGFTSSGFTASGFTTTGAVGLCTLTYRHNCTTLTSTTDVVDCCYHQFRVRKDACNLISLYVDNVLQDSCTDATDATVETPLEFATCNNRTCFFDGNLDSVRWYAGGTVINTEVCSLFNVINPISIDKFGGRATKINKMITAKKVVAQSFGKSLAEVEVRPTLYNCRSPEFIVHDLIVNNTDFISVPFNGRSGITITQYFADGKLFDIVDDLLTLFGATFYTTAQKLFFCVLREFSIKPNVFRHGCNTSVFETKFNDTELVNDLTVLGENKRYQKIELLDGDGSSFVYCLAEPAISTRVEHPVGTELLAEVDFAVNPQRRLLTFACAPACGMCNILVAYEFERPLFMRSKSQSSIDKFGVHAKRLVLSWIQTRSDGLNFMNGYLNRYNDIRKNLIIDHPFLLSSLRENDVIRVINSIKEIDSTFVIKSLKWEYPEFKTTLTVGEYTFDDFEFDKQIARKIHDLESAISTIKDLRDFEGPEELLALSDVVTVANNDASFTECLGITDTVCVTEMFDAVYDEMCCTTTYDGNDAYV